MIDRRQLRISWNKAFIADLGPFLQRALYHFEHFVSHSDTQSYLMKKTHGKGFPSSIRQASAEIFIISRRKEKLKTNH